MAPASRPIPPEDLLAHASFLQHVARELVADAHAAADLAQDTWVVALERPPTRGASLGGWLATVAKNLAHNARRSSRRRTERESRVARAETVDGDERSLERLELQRSLLDLLLALPDEQRTVLYLRFYEGRTPSAIANELGVPVETVKTRQARALAALRARLDARSGGDRQQWMQALAPLAIPSAVHVSAGSVIGGLTMKKFAVVGLVALLAAFGWWTLAGSAVDRSDAIEPTTTVSALVPPGIPPTPIEVELARTSPAAPRAALASNERVTTGALDVVLSWSDGSPAADIGIAIRVAEDPAPRAETQRGTTDAAGVVHFADLRAGMVALHPDMRLSFRAEVEAGTTRTVAYTIPTGLEIVGRVVDPAGEAAIGASIWNQSWLDESTDTRFAISCGTDGSFRLRDVMRYATFGARARGFQPSPCVRAADIPVRPDGVRTVELQLASGGGRVRGRVLDPDGVPVAKARVFAGPHSSDYVELPARVRAVAPHPATVETAADGTFEIFDDLGAGTQPVFASARGFPVRRGEFEVVAGVETWVDVRLEHPARIEGVLLDLFGRPIPGVEVIAAHEEDGGWYWHPFPAVRRTSDELGRFVLEWIPPGRCELNAHDEERPEIGRAQAVVDCVSGTTTKCELRLTRGLTIVGRAEDADGAPLRGWHIEAETQFSQWHTRSATSAVDGSFTLLNLREGECELSVRAPNHGPTRARLARVAVGTKDVVLVVPDAHVESGSFRGRVVDPARATPAEVTITLWPAGKREGRYVDFDARTSVFEGRAVPGRYRLKFSRGMRDLLLSAEFDVPENGLVELGEVELPAPGRIEIELTGFPLEALAAVTVSLERHDGPGQSEQLEARGGVWRSSDIAPGTWMVELRENELCLRDAEVVVRPGETVRVERAVETALRVPIRIRTGTRSDLTIDVRDGNGKFLRRERWAANAVHQPFSHAIPVPAGRVVIEVRTEDGRRARVELDATEALTHAPPTEIVLNAGC